MTEILDSFLGPGDRLRVIGAEVLNGLGEIDKVLDKVTEQKTYEGLQKRVRQSMSLIRVQKEWTRHIPGRHPRLLQR